jgi:TRAP-type mannitol/chloroaromatic compound transport system substrate-binding protein
MDRREFLARTGAAAAVTAAGASAATSDVPDNRPDILTKDVAAPAPAIAGDVRHFVVALASPDGVAGPADQAHRLAERIAVMSGGRYRLQFTRPRASGVNAVAGGEAELYFASESDHLATHRALSFFSGLPGDRGIAAHHFVAWIHVGGGQVLWDDLAADFGVKAILAGHGGEGVFVASEAITDMSELAGRKAAVAGLACEVARGLGLEPVVPEPDALAERLERGEILAAEIGGAAATCALGLGHAAPYATGASINRHGSALSLGFKRSIWEKLPASDQALFAAAAAAETQLAICEDLSYRRLLRPRPQLEATWTITAELERAIARVADAVVAQVASSDAMSSRIDASYQAFRRVALGEEAEATAGV